DGQRRRERPSLGQRHRFLGRVGEWLIRPGSPPGLELLPRVAGVLGADPFAVVVIESAAVVDPHRARMLRRRVALVVDAVVDLADGVLRFGDLAREDACGACLSLVLFTFARRELIATLGTDAIGGMDHRLALRALLGRRFTAARGAIVD